MDDVQPVDPTDPTTQLHTTITTRGYDILRRMADDQGVTLGALLDAWARALGSETLGPAAFPDEWQQVFDAARALDAARRRRR